MNPIKKFIKLLKQNPKDWTMEYFFSKLDKKHNISFKNSKLNIVGDIYLSFLNHYPMACREYYEGRIMILNFNYTLDQKEAKKMWIELKFILDNIQKQEREEEKLKFLDILSKFLRERK